MNAKKVIKRINEASDRDSEKYFKDSKNQIIEDISDTRLMFENLVLRCNQAAMELVNAKTPPELEKGLDMFVSSIDKFMGFGNSSLKHYLDRAKENLEFIRNKGYLKFWKE
jgi:hypothetical protein